MPRLPHGAPVTADQVQQARQDIAERSTAVPLAFAASSPVDLHDFDYMFPTLQNPTDLLAESPETPKRLKRLGRTMVDVDQLGGANDSPIPAAYTYFGQFVDHDITLEVQPAGIPPTTSGDMDQLLSAGMAPLPLQEIRSAVRNFRTATLDLDSLYGPPAPRDPANGDKLRIGTVSPTGGQAEPFVRPPHKSDDNDVPREPRREGELLHDRAALIGDPRNDENLIVSQLHLAFLKAHNALVDQGRTFQEARRLLRQHYQHIVISDFLRRVADPAIVDRVLRNGNRWYNALAEPFFMPLEFSVAAYRFGHTMVRGAYNFNTNFNFADGRPATLELLFTFTALSGQLGDFDTLPENWIIEWENIVGPGATVGKARRIDTNLAKAGDLALFNLQTLDGQREGGEEGNAARLAVRNLLRGYRLRLPTGQAVAGFLGEHVLTDKEIRGSAGSPEQVQALEEGGFLDRTPLWYYILAEAKHHGGARLGPVGSTLVAEVLIGLVRRSRNSILRSPGWVPSLPSTVPGTFELADLLRFAGVLRGDATARSYTVKRGDTLSKIAQHELGDAKRWPEIFALNRAVLRHPDRLFPGQLLTLPGSTPMQPTPRFHVVQPGDTLSEIAQEKLGNAARWREIFTLNSGVLDNPDLIVVGQVLLLPA